MTSEGQWIEVDKRWFKDNLYPLDIVTQFQGIKFKGRICIHLLKLRRGNLVAKIVSDMHCVDPTRYYRRTACVSMEKTLK